MPSSPESSRFSLADKRSANIERRVIPLSESEGRFSDDKVDEIADEIVKVIKKKDKIARSAPGAKIQNRILRAFINGDIPNPHAFTNRVKELASQNPEKNLSGEAEDFLAGVAIASEAANREQQFLAGKYSDKEVMVGTNDFLDSRMQVDLVAIVWDKDNEDEIEEIRLTQIKGKGMRPDEVNAVRGAHRKFVEQRVASPEAIKDAIKMTHVKRGIETEWFWESVLEEGDEGDIAVRLQEYFGVFLIELTDSDEPIDTDNIERWADEIGMNVDLIKIFFETKKGKQVFDIFTDTEALDQNKVGPRFKELRKWAADHEVSPETVEDFIPDNFQIDVRSIKKITSVIYDQVGTRMLDEEEIDVGEVKGARVIDIS